MERLSCTELVGDVVLNKLKIKKTALDKLDLPIRIMNGSLGELTMKIPWKNLKSEPVKILIKNLLLITEPVSLSSSPVAFIFISRRAIRNLLRRNSREKCRKSSLQNCFACQSMMKRRRPPPLSPVNL